MYCEELKSAFHHALWARRSARSVARLSVSKAGRSPLVSKMANAKVVETVNSTPSWPIGERIGRNSPNMVARRKSQNVVSDRNVMSPGLRTLQQQNDRAGNRHGRDVRRYCSHVARDGVHHELAHEERRHRATSPGRRCSVRQPHLPPAPTDSDRDGDRGNDIAEPGELELHQFRLHGAPFWTGPTGGSNSISARSCRR